MAKIKEEDVRVSRLKLMNQMHDSNYKLMTQTQDSNLRLKLMTQEGICSISINQIKKWNKQSKDGVRTKEFL